MRASRNIGLSIVLLSAFAAAGCTVVFSASESQGACDEDACKAAGGNCTTPKECRLTCLDASCGCPAGHNCFITVPVDYSDNIDCSAAKECTIMCGAEAGSCGGSQILCGEDCDVKCVGEYQCHNNFGVFCGSGDCNLSCLAKGSCWGANVYCGEAENCEFSCGGSACDGATLDCDEAQACIASCPASDACDGTNLMCTNPERCDFECPPELDPVCTSP